MHKSADTTDISIYELPKTPSSCTLRPSPLVDAEKARGKEKARAEESSKRKKQGKRKSKRRKARGKEKARAEESEPERKNT